MTALDFKLWRIARGLTQRQVGEMFDVPQQTISLWETEGPPDRVPAYIAFEDKFAQVNKQLGKNDNATTKNSLF